MLSFDDYVQAIVGVLVITDPLGKAVFFLMFTKDKPQTRTRAALLVALTVGLILGVSALAGRELLDIMGIHLGAFGFAGGVIVALMGLEMLADGSPSRAQGGDSAREGVAPDDSLLVPFSMPFIAGPGAITVVITLAARADSWQATWMALLAVGVSVLTLLFSFLVLGKYLAKMSDRAITITTRFGGLIVATIGVQLAFNGIKSFFGLQ